MTAWCHARGTFFDQDGQPVRMIGVQQDVTDRRNWQERQKVLLQERQHRTRNLLSVVRSICDETLRSSNGLDDFGRKFRERISAWRAPRPCCRVWREMIAPPSGSSSTVNSPQPSTLGTGGL
ncbi:hypothetical protein ACO34A_28490 (plasmid) [Rhizobium sp. ACO-34A]|nr:hypothetical protein ACO34A_28490 [Rhizobium sp. ACO-34A]